MNYLEGRKQDSNADALISDQFCSSAGFVVVPGSRDCLPQWPPKTARTLDHKSSKTKVTASRTSSKKRQQLAQIKEEFPTSGALAISLGANGPGCRLRDSGLPGRP